MKRATHFWIALATAAITFGSLMVFAGPQNSGWHHYRHGWGGHRHHHDDWHDDHEHSRIDRTPSTDGNHLNH